MKQTSFLSPKTHKPVIWKPTHTAAADRLAYFLPHAGGVYAKQRNYDLGPEDRSNVSALSPWVRHRLILEEDILRHSLARHSFRACEKFIQEVFWRGYFKGWLEHHPDVWKRYKKNLVHFINQMETDASLARRYDEAVSGKTGIDCFDAWVGELINKGYLHNHARMWFASIWIFTLKLPWELGADFFYRHLLDGDPASNTCSWRWVGGLHTKGKTYLARAANINQFTDERFNPTKQLAVDAVALSEPELPPLNPPSFPAPKLPGPRVGLLICEEDCTPESLVLPCRPVALFALADVTSRSVLPIGLHAKAFAPSAVRSAAKKSEAYFEQACTVMTKEDLASALLDWSHAEKLDCILTARLPIGPVQKRVHNACKRSNLLLIEVTRSYDQIVWPNAKGGFFGLKKKIPTILTALGIT